ncbi:hypothetical protein EST38_g11783 [Candolleomyces aberdarensis]|uniref:UvrD-like helicase ATP-binding domain-containing protein n=1 Tax=Candolleomyces aberdarensis TaxID=2316362 RepID=A0A4Q2D412_9AGAR|nr:hypothetical protein EST38_g11783 [Candolleomyces aberdarensis]
MKPDARNALPERWLSKLCSKLSSAQSVEDVQSILDRLDISLLSDSQVETVLRQLLDTAEHKQLLELVLASWLLESFPKYLVDDFQALIHCEILKRLSYFLASLPCAFDRERQLFLSESRLQVEKTPHVLKYMVDLARNEIEDVDDVDEADSDGFAIRNKQKQYQQKKAHKTKMRNSGLEEQDLALLNVTDPQTEEEASFNAWSLLDILKRTLSEYFDLLREPEICLTIQRMAVDSVPTNAGDHEARNQQPANGSAPEEAPADSTPAAYPCIQPMTAALYFESASGFGEWQILISSRADRDLRNARRSDAKFFKIVIKKIIKLSNGHFSDDNQRRLNKSDVQFPVFEAKMTGATRLVYQIDCIPEYDNNYERQVIKIFGIFTHTKNKRFWDSMGYQLSKKGKTYRDRCTFRNRPHHRGDYAIPPASFPLLENEVPDNNIIPELPKEDLDEIHSLLVLEKFVTLSKELLKSIFVDLDVAHVFNVTPQEKEIIEHPHSCYVIGRSGTGKTTTMLFKMLGIERAYAQQSEISSVARPRQIFVTQSRVLATRVEEYFSKLLQSLAAAKKSKEELKEIAEQKKFQEEGDITLYDVEDDVVNRKAGLPQKFSLLQGEHFPLFLTFERLCQLLEGDIENTLDVFGDNRSQLVTYNVFFEQYWPRFPQGLTKNLDPALVFSEFLGVIKGSEQSLSHETRCLDLTAYRNLSHRAQHVFAKQRDRIYSLFQAYVKYKKQRGEYDTADRTHRILKAFDATGVPGAKIDYLYVDEAQDNILIDAMLLRSLCRNPNGLFWAGDTAQTIAIGSSFVFNDLKAFLYRLEQHREQGERGVTQSELRTFQLAVNYRSHGGIVRCATAVVELITHFWPYAIDSLVPEQGIVDGAKPIFFSGWDTDTFKYEQFLSGPSTLYESKGLEFDDVLLYKFFEDSPVDLSQWRVVLNLVGPLTKRSVNVPRFDEARHAGVCSELKFLYVAITRSRKNLWIVDRSDKAEPMKVAIRSVLPLPARLIFFQMLWESKGYIQSCVPGDEVPRIAVSSTPKEWSTAGRNLFRNRRYMQAVHAFERAGMAREAKISHTHYLRDVARSIQSVNKETRSAKWNAFCSAAQSFLECAYNAKDTERRVFFHNAADCFENAGSCGDNMEAYGEAAHAYEDADEYTPAARLYMKTEMFDKAVNVVRNHRFKVDKELANTVQDVARLFYLKNKELKKAMTLFESIEELLQYLEDNILLDDCHAAVLADLGRYQEAADIHLSEGRTMEAIDVLLDDKENEESRRRANDCILQGLWETTSFSQRIKDTDVAALEFLRLASKVDEDATRLSPTQKDELEMFQNLHTSDDATTFRQLACRFLGRKEIHQTVLCFDHYFINFPSTLEVTNADMVTILEDFGQYCRSFRDLILGLDVGDEYTQKIFNFRPASIGNVCRIRTETWLYQQVMDVSAKLQVLENDDEFIVVSSHELQHFLKAVLWQRLEQRILDENSLCHLIRVFTPCLVFVMNGECRRVNCPRHHVDYQELTQDWFDRQVRVHLLQILIYHLYLGIPTPKNRAQTIQDRRYWIHRFHETLRPPAHYLGSETSVFQAVSKVPEAAPGSQTIVKWLRDILGNQELPFDRMLLTFLYEGASLLMLFDRNARSDLLRVPLLSVFAGQPSYYRRNGTVYAVPELYHCLKAADNSFISAGILFFQHIVDRRIFIDANALCHLFEFLAGSVILARVQFNLHNVVLPRGWILALLHQIAARKPDTISVDRLLLYMQTLLEILIKGGEEAKYLLFEGRDISELPTFRALFIHRICRAMVLIGCNIPDNNLRDDIFRMLRVLETTRAHHSFRRMARSWGGIVIAVRTSCTNSHLDEMVQFYSTEMPSPERPPPEGIQRIFFKNLDDVSSALSTVEAQGDTASEMERPAEHQTEQPEVVVLDLEQKDVALRLLHMYRKRVRNKKLEMRKTTTQKACDSYFETCLRLALNPEKMQWPYGFYYRKLYLGLVPHLLACVKGVEEYAFSAKARIRKRYGEGERLDYDKMHKTMSEIVTIIKGCRKLGPRLDPSSEVHKRRDIEGLKQLVREVEELVNRVPSGAGLNVHFNLQLAIKGITEPKRGG